MGAAHWHCMVTGFGESQRGARGLGIYYDQASLAPGEGLYFNKPYYDFKLYYPLPGLPLTSEQSFPARLSARYPRIRTRVRQASSHTLLPESGTSPLNTSSGRAAWLTCLCRFERNQDLVGSRHQSAGCQPAASPIRDPCRSSPTSLSRSRAAIRRITAFRHAFSSGFMRESPLSFRILSENLWMTTRLSFRALAIRISRKTVESRS